MIYFDLKGKLLPACLLSFSIIFTNMAQATDSYVSNAKITSIEFYGKQFTVYFDKTHNATACGHSRSAAMDSSTEPGKSYLAAFLVAWTTGRTVNVVVTDAICSGDRPTIKHWSAS